MANRSFMIGGLIGLPIAVYGVRQAVNLTFGHPVEPPSEEATASAALLLAGSVALVLSRYLPAWFIALETGAIVVDDPNTPPKP